MVNNNVKCRKRLFIYWNNKLPQQIYHKGTVLIIKNWRLQWPEYLIDPITNGNVTAGLSEYSMKCSTLMKQSGLRCWCCNVAQFCCNSETSNFVMAITEQLGEAIQQIDKQKAIILSGDLNCHTAKPNRVTNIVPNSITAEDLNLINKQNLKMYYVTMETVLLI